MVIEIQTSKGIYISPGKHTAELSIPGTVAPHGAQHSELPTPGQGWLALLLTSTDPNLRGLFS